MRKGTVAIFLLLLIAPRIPVWISLFIGADPNFKQLCGVLSVMLIIVMTLYSSKKWPEYASFDKTVFALRWKHYLLIPVFAIALLVCSIPIGSALNKLGYQKPPYIDLPRGVFLFVNWLLVIVLSPIAEEIFWRGYALDQFRKRMRCSSALVLQATLVSIVHFPILGVWCITMFGWGIILGYYRIRYRALLPIIMCHILVNFMAMVPALADYINR